MKFLDMQQGSPEWHALRREHIGASMAPVIMGKSAYTTPYQLWEQMVWDKQKERTPAMERGSALEPEARRYFEEKYQCAFPSAVAISDERPWQMASLDGINTERKIILEIKCPGQRVFTECERGQLPDDYIWQIQHQLVVTHYPLAILLIFGRGAPKEFRFTPDYEMMNALNEQEEIFYKRLLDYDPPPLTDRDWAERTDFEWEQSVKEYTHAKNLRMEWEELEETAKKRLIELSQGQSSRGCGITLTKYVRKGNVEYSKIPQLSGLDLEQFRKPPSEQWRVS